MSAPVRVEVAYARPDVQAVESVLLPAGATVRDAIRASGLLVRFPRSTSRRRAWESSDPRRGWATR